MIKPGLLILLFVCSIPWARTQTRIFALMDSVNSVADTNYFLAKKMLLSIEKKQRVDPAQKIFFLTASLDNKDLNYFKKEIRHLIITGGFRYTKSNLELYSRQKNFTRALAVNGLEGWMQKESDRYFPVWVKNHPVAFEVQTQMEILIAVDQVRTSFYDMLYDEAFDSLQVELKLQKFDRKNLNHLIAITDQLGVLPNNLDHGMGTYYLWQICFFHNLYPETIDEVWTRMLPYIEHAYFEGKIDDGLFRLYDFQLNMLFGYQYYGFLEGVPVKDEAGLSARKQKYGFL